MFPLRPLLTRPLSDKRPPEAEVQTSVADYCREQGGTGAPPVSTLRGQEIEEYAGFARVVARSEVGAVCPPQVVLGASTDGREEK